MVVIFIYINQTVHVSRFRYVVFCIKRVYNLFALDKAQLNREEASYE